MFYNRNIDIKYDVDVFVAGGGPAGVAAAVSAARQGKRVFLAEESGAFGGMGTIGLVPELMNFGDGINALSSGFGKEMLVKLFGEDVLPRIKERNGFKVKVEDVKRAYDELMVSSGANFTFFTKVSDAVAKDGVIEYVVLSGKSGLFAVKADVYIDCTGDGTLSYLAGAEYKLGNENGRTMPATLCSIWANIDFCKCTGNDDRYMKQAIEDGIISQYDPHLPGIFPVDKEHGIGGGNVGHCFNINPTDEKSLTEAMLFGRKLIQEYIPYYKEYLKNGYENLALVETANVMGVRESRRIIGDKIIEDNDYLNCTVFDDEIGRYSYPMDIHSETPDKEGIDNFNMLMSVQHKAGESYGIPYGALVPKGMKNLLVAGKCISASRKIQASVRVIPGCYITGQAAGTAAALTCKNRDVRSVDIRSIQEKLIEQGVYLPNCKR